MYSRNTNQVNWEFNTVNSLLNNYLDEINNVRDNNRNKKNYFYCIISGTLLTFISH